MAAQGQGSEYDNTSINDDEITNDTNNNTTSNCISEYLQKYNSNRLVGPMFISG